MSKLVCIVIFLVSGTATALPLDAGFDLAYRETFFETAFPTSPEMDTLGLGSLNTVLSGTGSATIDSANGFVDIMTSAGSTVGIGPDVISSSAVMGVDAFGLRGGFEDFSFTGSGQTGFFLSTSSGMSVGTISAAIAVGPDVTTPSVLLTDGTTALAQVALSASQISALNAGDFYTLDFLVDSNTGEAIAAVSIAGIETTTGNIDVSSLLLGGDIGIGVFSQDFEGAPGNTHSIRLTQFEGFVPIPEPSSTLLIGAGLGFFAARRTRTV